MAARREHGLLDPDAALGTSPFDHTVYVLTSDGDLQEGVTGEASSIAGTQEPGNLAVIWDDNRISIQGDTDIAFTEDVAARYAAYGWHVQVVDWTAGPGGYVEDVGALQTAIEAAVAASDRPSTEARPPAPPGRSATTRGAPPTPTSRPCSTGCGTARCHRTGRSRCPPSRPARRWPPARRLARSSLPSARCYRSCGAGQRFADLQERMTDSRD